MIQLHQSDWIMISVWVASASSFLSLPAIPSSSSSSSLYPLSLLLCLLFFFFHHIFVSSSPPRAFVNVPKGVLVQRWTVICLPSFKKKKVPFYFYLHGISDAEKCAPSLPSSLSSLCQRLASSGGRCSVGAVLFSGCHIDSVLWEGDGPESLLIL